MQIQFLADTAFVYKLFLMLVQGYLGSVSGSNQVKGFGCWSVEVYTVFSDLLQR